jgi:hypothetical protein
VPFSSSNVIFFSVEVSSLGRSTVGALKDDAKKDGAQVTIFDCIIVSQGSQFFRFALSHRSSLPK